MVDDTQFIATPSIFEVWKWVWCTNQLPWSSTNKNGIKLLIDWSMPTLDLPDLLTYCSKKGSWCAKKNKKTKQNLLPVSNKVEAYRFFIWTFKRIWEIDNIVIQSVCNQILVGFKISHNLVQWDSLFFAWL